MIEENNVNSLKNPMRKEMQKSIDHLQHELTKLRTGRAHASLIEDIPVSCYGDQTMALKGVASISVPEARLLLVQPWDKGLLHNVEKAIKVSGLGLTPTSDGDYIRIRLPDMTTERREELVKILGKKLEECKVDIRNRRKDFNNIIRDAKTKKTISEDFYNRLGDVLQEVTDEFCKQAEDICKKKKEAITTV